LSQTYDFHQFSGGKIFKAGFCKYHINTEVLISTPIFDEEVLEHIRKKTDRHHTVYPGDLKNYTVVPEPVISSFFRASVLFTGETIHLWS